MKYEATDLGRAWVIRLDDGDCLHDCIEEIAGREDVQRAVCLALGGADAHSKLVVGPEDGRAAAITPQVLALQNVHEMAAVGTVFPNEAGQPILHMHAVCGRGDGAVSGCVRQGVKTWLVGEVVMLELVGGSSRRVREGTSGLELLELD